MLSESDRQHARFSEGDAVAFSWQHKRVEGRLIRMNPKRAVVLVGEEQFAVPYEILIPMSGNSEERLLKMETVQRVAHQLMQTHGLHDWSFKFDHSSRRAGCCFFRDKIITLAFDLARTGTEENIRDTLLHEIAHALVGKKHNHDAVWKAKAREIGGSAARTHSLQFAQPRWSVRCENQCWANTAQKRNSRLICRKCGGKLIYSPYTQST